MKTFHCHCGNSLHFENTRCLACGRTVGFIPEALQLSAFEPAANGAWQALLPEVKGQTYRMCNHYLNDKVCNWMIASADPEPFCRACRLNQMIPNLSEPKNHVLWLRIERAKRRLLYTLYDVGLHVAGRDADPERGLSFEFLADLSGGEFSDDMGHRSRVMTGHKTGLITINIAEADASAREEIREKMGEGYRTLLGHFRHEIGHYYWDRLIAGTHWLEGFRVLFGDERTDYAAALKNYYARGAPPDWPKDYISAYATAHPWEDWAESWAHYLHMVDTLDTAYDFGFAIEGRELRPPSAGAVPAGTQLAASFDFQSVSFDEILTDWMRLTVVMNALNRSMGLRDAYPFALSGKAAEKLRFINSVITAAVGTRH